MAMTLGTSSGSLLGHAGKVANLRMGRCPWEEREPANGQSTEDSRRWYDTVAQESSSSKRLLSFQRTSPRWPDLTLAVTARQQPWEQWCSESRHHQRLQVRRPQRYRGMETGQEVPLWGEQDNWGSRIYPRPSSQRDPGQIAKGSRLWLRLDTSVRHLEAFSGSSLSWD